LYPGPETLTRKKKPGIPVTVIAPTEPDSRRAEPDPNLAVTRQWLNSVSYTSGLALQEQVAQRVINTSTGVVLGLEHLAVVTLGKRATVSEDLQITGEQLSRLGFDLAHVDRGGHATMHGPGQLVIYPILPLKVWKIGVRDYVEGLQRATISLLQEFGIQANCKCNEPGLYTSRGKIAFFGIRVSKGVSTHGLSLNVSNDLGAFSIIRSCGRVSETFDSLRRCGQNLELSAVFNLWFNQFLKTFSLTEVAEKV
jgi:lipoate-protein ligase B